MHRTPHGGHTGTARAAKPGQNAPTANALNARGRRGMKKGVTSEKTGRRPTLDSL